MFVDMDFVVNSPENLQEVAGSILGEFREQRIFLFFGEMGAGKTTLIKAFCKKLKIADSASSPTYSLVNEYQTEKGSVYHFDFYRLETETEALDMGYEEYFYSGNYCFIEWPEKISNLWPDEYVKVQIDILSANERNISASSSNK